VPSVIDPDYQTLQVSETLVCGLAMIVQDDFGAFIKVLDFL
jgi:hypothetical protein